MNKFSILMLSYNQFEFLPQAVSSVLSQEGVEFELIVVDPGSTDESREFLRGIAQSDDRIVLVFESDSGPSDGLRKALGLAKNEIIGCLNSDDYYLPRALSRVEISFDEAPHASFLYSHGYILKAGVLRFQACDKITQKRMIMGASLFLHQTSFYRREELQKRKISFNPSNRSCWDFEILVDLILAGGTTKLVNDVWAVFRIHSQSISGSGRLEVIYHSEMKQLTDKLSGGEHYFFESLLFRPVYFYLAVLRRIRSTVLSRKFN